MPNGNFMNESFLQSITPESVKLILQEVKDPEVPVLTIEELGILREVVLKDGIFEIIITPTYSGCPALQAITDEIKTVMEKHGILNYKIRMVYTPAWTTDWMSEAAREKLRAYGIAPPSQSTASHLEASLSGKSKPVKCPFCGKTETKLTSAFGSTACKALHFCNHCRQPFEEFKCH
jgi:ring-1,2-phenylacetyl-CoA epoxidase subunit PaaD